MRLEELCVKLPVTVERSASVRYAANLMRREHVGAIIVTERLIGVDRPVGILTDRDIVLKAVAEPRDLDVTSVSDIMSEDVQCISKGETLEQAIMQMQRAEVRRLVLTDVRGAACGLISADDVVAEVSNEMRLIGSLFQRQIGSEKARVSPAERRQLFE